MAEERTIVETTTISVVVTTYSDGTKEARAFSDGIGISSDEAYDRFADFEDDTVLSCKDAIGEVL